MSLCVRDQPPGASLRCHAPSRLLLVGSILALWGLPLLDLASAHAAVTREEVERAIRDGVRFLKQAAARRRLLARRRRRRADRHDQPGHAGPADRRRAGRTRPTIVTALEFLRNFGPEQLEEHLRRRAPDDGLRRRRPRPRPVADRRQRRAGSRRPRSSPATASTGPARGRYSDVQDPPRRQLEHPVRPARPERRQRGRRPGQARGLGPGPALLGAIPAATTAAGATRPTTPCRPPPA